MDFKTICSIIDDYSEPAYEACRDDLYDILKFAVIEKNAVTKNELKEKLYDYLRVNEAALENENIFLFFAESVYKAVNSHISSENDRCALYLEKLNKCTLAIKEEKADIAALENAVLIYLPFFRAYKAAMTEEKEECQVKLETAPVFYVDSSDSDIAKYILEKINVVKFNELVAKWNDTKVAKKTIKLKNEEFSDDEKELVFVITTLVLYRILQIEGEI